MVLDVGEDVDLVDRALLELLVLLEFVYRDHLDRVFLLVVVVYRTIDLPVDARADRLVQHVVFDVFDHCAIH